MIMLLADGAVAATEAAKTCSAEITSLPQALVICTSIIAFVWFLKG